MLEHVIIMRFFFIKELHNYLTYETIMNVLKSDII